MKFTHYPAVRWWLGFISPACDSSYASPVPQEIMLRTSTNIDGADAFARGRTPGGIYRTGINAARSLTQTLGMSFYGIGFGVSVNPLHPSGKREDTKYSFHYYGNRLGFDFSYGVIRSFHGSALYDGGTFDIPVGLASQKLYQGSVYYVFNHSRFSLASALSQTWYQNRSAGSLIGSVLFIGGNIDIPTLPETDFPAAHMRIYLTGAGVGYGYNFVTPHNWLIHVSAIPGLGLLSSSDITLDGEERNNPISLANFTTVARFSAVRWWGRYVLKVNANGYNVFMHDPRNMSVDQTQWDAQVSVGMTF